MPTPSRTKVDAKKRIVERGYDRIARAYAAARTTISRRDSKYLALLTARLSPGSRELDLGCGAGVGITKALADRHEVTGVDFSRRQLELAQKAVPNATFVRGDMTKVKFRPGSFDAITSFAAVIHVPREQHRPLFRRMHQWLKPGALLLVTLGTDDWVSSDRDRFFGVPMYWSQFDAETGKRLVRESGFHILRSSIEREEFHGETEEHLYLFAARIPTRTHGAASAFPSSERT